MGVIFWLVLVLMCNKWNVIQSRGKLMGISLIYLELNFVRAIIYF